MIEGPKGKELTGDLERITVQKAEGYCACFSLVRVGEAEA